MRKLSLLLLTLIALNGQPDTARAGFAVGFGQASYDVAPGASVDVSVYLVETGSDNALQTDGLFSAGLLVSFNLSPFASDPAQATSVTPGADFDITTGTSVNSSATSTSAGSAEINVAAFTSLAYPDSATPDRILLGTIAFQAGTTAGQTTLLGASTLDPSQNEFVTGTGTVLDSVLTYGSSRIHVSGSNAVPEPSTTLLLAFGMAGTAGLARFRPRYRSVSAS